MRIFNRLPAGLLALVLAAAPLANALPTTSVVIENLLGGDTDPSAALFDVGGLTRLSAGTAANGDGTLVVLGYFTGSSTAATFSGTWVPLTGPASANSGIPTTTIGDTDSNVSGPFGFFTAQLNFDQGNPSTTFQSTPSVGTRLAVAVYNGTTIAGSTHFNIATNDAWRWKAPTFFPDLVSINLNDLGTTWFSGPANARTTSQARATFPGVLAPARLLNISTRGFVGTGDTLLIPGFVMDGASTRTVLIRAVGPTLETQFGVSGVLADPQLRVVLQSNGTEVAANDNWSDQPNSAAIAAAMESAGAFPLPEGSLDAAVLLELPAAPGGYTVQVTGVGGGTGVVIAEVYVIGDGSGSNARPVNISTRGLVGTGDAIMIPGFALGAGGQRRLLIRAVGPTLETEFGLPGVLADPVLRVFRTSDDALVAENDDWESGGQGPSISTAVQQVGAFDLEPGSADAALILVGDGAGGYTVQISGASGETGLAITEVYELP